MVTNNSTNAHIVLDLRSDNVIEFVFRLIKCLIWPIHYSVDCWLTLGRRHFRHSTCCCFRSKKKRILLGQYWIIFGLNLRDGRWALWWTEAKMSALNNSKTVRDRPCVNWEIIETDERATEWTYPWSPRLPGHNPPNRVICIKFQPNGWRYEKSVNKAHRRMYCLYVEWCHEQSCRPLRLSRIPQMSEDRAQWRASDLVTSFVMVILISSWPNACTCRLLIVMECKWNECIWWRTQISHKRIGGGAGVLFGSFFPMFYVVHLPNIYKNKKSANLGERDNGNAAAPLNLKIVAVIPNVTERNLASNRCQLINLKASWTCFMHFYPVFNYIFATYRK